MNSRRDGTGKWNFANHFAIKVHGLFPSFHCDLDVINVHLANKRPDIILHSRGTNDRNFLVIEAKRDGTSGEMRADLEKIHDYWFGDPLHYQYGAAVNLRSDKVSKSMSAKIRNSAMLQPAR